MERFLSILLVASTTTARKLVVVGENEWDSVVISSPPVKITNSRFNPKNSTKTNPGSLNPPSRVARMIKDCNEGDLKCLYDTHLHENSTVRNPQDTIQKFLEKYSSVTNVKINHDLRNSSSKAYWNQIDSQKHNHPFDDVKGWQTMEPVPWSQSKVTRWKPNGQGDQPPSPWGYGPPQTQHQPKPPQSPTNLWVSNNMPSSGQSWANDIITHNGPNDFPMDNSIPNFPNRPQTGPHGYPAFTPPNPAIPQGYQPPSTPQYRPHYYQQIEQKPPFQQMEQKPHYQWQEPTSSQIQVPPPAYNPQPNIDSQYHPPTYPDKGQGEWVLVSTTKGYSIPQRYQDRQMHIRQSLSTQTTRDGIVSRDLKSKYQEKNLSDKYMMVQDYTSDTSNRKSDTLSELGPPVWHINGVNILHKDNLHKDLREGKSSWNDDPIAEPEDINFSEGKDAVKEADHPSPQLNFKRTVRLTVLPALNNTSVISDDGMLEIDANKQSVEEAQQHEERMKKLQQIAIVNSGRVPYQLHPVSAVVPRANSDGTNKRKAAVLAAVGAG